MTRAEITPLILTYNEEANLERVLARLAWARRVVVVDSFSTDRTLDIAARWRNVEVVQRPFDNHTDQWNFALAQVHTAWVLCLDADYVLSHELIVELEGGLDLASDGYDVHFRYCVGGRPLRGSLYPPRIVLVRRDRARYVADGHTQRLQLSGEVRHLRSMIYHDDRKPLARWLEAQNRYADLEVSKLTRTPVAELSRTDRIRRAKFFAPWLAPLYCLVRRGLILDGPAGWYYTLQRTYAELLLSIKLHDHDLRERSGRVAAAERDPDGSETMRLSPGARPGAP